MNGTAYRVGRTLGGVSCAVRVVAEHATALFFCILFFSFILQIFMRFFLNRPLNWPEELSVICYMWIVFVACSFTLRDSQHVIFTIVVQSLPRQVRKVLAIIASLVVAVALLWVSYGIVDYVSFMRVETTPALFLRKDHVFSVFIIFTAALILRCLWTALVTFFELFCPKVFDALTDGFYETAGLAIARPEEAA
jgi:TRAP-type C4-dicarboxylate transport system permease small subunit